MPSPLQASYNWIELLLAKTGSVYNEQGASSRNVIQCGGGNSINNIIATGGISRSQQYYTTNK